MQSLGPVEFLRVLDRSLMLSYHEVRTRVAEVLRVALASSVMFLERQLYITHLSN
jgi:hypothetical protein